MALIEILLGATLHPLVDLRDIQLAGTSATFFVQSVKRDPTCISQGINFHFRLLSGETSTSARCSTQAHGGRTNTPVHSPRHINPLSTMPRPGKRLAPFARFRACELCHMQVTEPRYVLAVPIYAKVGEGTLAI